MSDGGGDGPGLAPSLSLHSLRDRLFPVAPLPEEPIADGKHGRACRQRVCRRRAVVAKANATINALNCLGVGGEASRLPHRSSPAVSQPSGSTSFSDEVGGRVLVDVERGPRDSCCSLQDASLRAMLTKKGNYSTESVGDVVSMDVAQLSLPSESSMLRSPPLTSVASSRANSFLNQFHNLMLKSEEEVLRDGDHLGEPSIYTDPSLRSRSKYLSFLQVLFARGILRWTTRCKSNVGVFCVSKKNGKQRLIVDARAANRHFRAPPSTCLSTAEQLADIRTTHDGDLFFGFLDIMDCFYRYVIDEEYSQYFCLAPVSSHEASEIDTSFHGEGTRQWWPCLRVLPMGHTWSLFFAQECNTSMVHRTLNTEDLAASKDKLVYPGRVINFVYVDNVGIIGCSADEVNTALFSVKDALDAGGLSTHDVQTAQNSTEMLGLKFDGVRHELRPTADRLQRAHDCISAILRRQRVRGDHLEVLIGHLTFIGLVRRDVLSIFHATYSFIHAAYSSSRPLWPSVRIELLCFQALLPLLHTSWNRRVANLVAASDASEDGGGITMTNLSDSAVHDLTTFCERERFKRLYGGKGARACAAKAMENVPLNPLKDVITGGPQPVNFDHCTELWETDGSFLEAPYEEMLQSHWVTTDQVRWRYDEVIHNLEARMVVRAATQLTNVCLPGDHAVILCDNLAVVLAMSRRRSKDFHLLRYTRQLAAISLASQITFHIRWIASETNPADLPSRHFSLSSPSSDLFRRVPLHLHSLVSPNNPRHQNWLRYHSQASDALTRWVRRPKIKVLGAPHGAQTTIAWLHKNKSSKNLPLFRRRVPAAMLCLLR
jgi:hypothetical protein